MCRNIRTLHNFEPPATDEEITASALQYVRKISGFSKPSQANAEAFDRAVIAVTEVSSQLLSELVTTAPPKDREVEARRRRALAAPPATRRSWARSPDASAAEKPAGPAARPPRGQAASEGTPKRETARS